MQNEKLASVGRLASSIAREINNPFLHHKGMGGTGLGLWVNWEIVGRHNGFLTVRSSQKEGSHGTVFVLFLPFDVTDMNAGLE